MKMTVEINDDLIETAKRLAAEEGITLRALLEAGLRRELANRAAGGFTLVDSSVGGNGTQPGVAEGDWESARDQIYSGRGA
jgi:hypothetical protein